MIVVGLISYPLYLWHWPLLSYAWIISGGGAETEHGDIHGVGASPQTKLILLAASFVLAYLSYAFIEKPVRFGRHREAKAFGALGLLLVLGAIGGVIVANQGITSRFVAQSNAHLAEDLRIPTETRTTNGSCKRLLSISVEGEEAVCLANSTKPSLLIVGDSQAMALHSSIYKDIVKLPTVLLAANSYTYERPACLKDGDFESWFKGNEPCQQVVRNVLRLIEQVPSIATVIVLYQRDNPFYLDREKIERMQDAFLRAGKQVVYFLSTPGFWAPINTCQPRKISVLGMDLSPADASGNCRQPPSTFSELQDLQRRYIDSLRHGDPNTFIFDQLPAFCDSQYCYQAGPDGLWFWTLQHVNEKGSVRVLKNFMAWAPAHLKHFSQ
jgi:hypothetical protein